MYVWQLIDTFSITGLISKPGCSVLILQSEGGYLLRDPTQTHTHTHLVWAPAAQALDCRQNIPFSSIICECPGQRLGVPPSSCAFQLRARVCTQKESCCTSLCFSSLTALWDFCFEFIK